MVKTWMLHLHVRSLKEAEVGSVSWTPTDQSAVASADLSKAAQDQILAQVSPSQPYHRTAVRLLEALRSTYPISRTLSVSEFDNPVRRKSRQGPAIEY